MKRDIVITIDGPTGSGKGTVAKAVAERLGLECLDTGAMYRAFALMVQRSFVDPEDNGELTALLFETHITFEKNSDGENRVFLNREDVTDRIRTSEISSLASDVATKKVVRSALMEMQRRIGRNGGIVAEGRDMGTYVFPDADFKFFLDADLDERAKRRCLQLKERGMEPDFEEIRREIELRDKQDREREHSPLHPADNAVIIDTTDLTAEQVVDRIIEELGDLGK